MLSLHLIDPGTPDDALQMLALLIARSGGVAHRVLMLGRHSVAERARRAGIDPTLFHGAHSMGWADPAGWLAVRQAIRKLDPTHLHAWGLRGIVAASVQAAFAGPRIATLVVAPTARQMRLLRAAAGRVAWTFIGSSSCVQRTLLTGGLNPEQVLRIRPGISVATPNAPTAELRKGLELPPASNPVVLLGGEPEFHARHDLGLWAAGIVQQLRPETQILLRIADNLASRRAREFAEHLPAGPLGPIFCEVPTDAAWPLLARAADLMLVTPDGPICTGSILTAMAAGIPVIGTATPEVSELIEHGYNGLLAPPAAPRAIAARLAEYLADITLRWNLTDKARADVFAHFKPAFMLECFRAVYQQTLPDPRVKVELPQPELTAADRFG